MEPNKPLNTEEKLELEMDKVIEAEQTDVKNPKIFWIIAIIVLIIVLAIVYVFTR